MTPAGGALSLRSRLGLIGCFAFFLMFYAVPVLVPMPVFAVPVLENESVVVGEILERTIVAASTLGIEPEQKLWRLKLRVVSVEGVAGAENVLHGQEGKTIEVFSNEANAPGMTDKRVKLRISFHGPGRAARYWIVGMGELKSK